MGIFNSQMKDCDNTILILKNDKNKFINQINGEIKRT